MKNPDPLARYSALINNCSACGLCLPVCPVFAQTGLEPDGPRGKMLLAAGLAGGRILPKDVATPLSRCLMCGKCASACPRKLPLTEIFLACRKALAPFLPVSRKRRLLAQAMARWPKAWDFLQPPFALLQSISKRRHKLRATGHVSIARPLNMRSPDEEERPGGEAKQQVMLFPGCIVRRALPRVGQAALAALEAQGMQVLLPPELVCCGRPLALQGGKMKEAIQRNLEVIARHDFKWLITLCPACQATIKGIWGNADFLSSDERELAAKLAQRTIDINMILERDSQKQHPGRIFWHRPCLLDNQCETRILGLLGLKGSAEDSASCCGAPAFCLDPQKASQHGQTPGQLSSMLEAAPLTLAEALAKRIRSDAARSDCIVTACPGCMLALERIASIPVKHSVEVLGKSSHMGAGPLQARTRIGL